MPNVLSIMSSSNTVNSFCKKCVTQNIIIYNLFFFIWYLYMEASKPKWFNLILNSIGVNSLRLGGLHTIHLYWKLWVHNVQLLMYRLGRPVSITEYYNYYLNMLQWNYISFCPAGFHIFSIVCETRLKNAKTFNYRELLLHISNFKGAAWC